MKPPYDLTGNILSLISSISERIGEINAVHLAKPPTELRKRNRIKTIQSSLEIEGNTLTIEQITDILDQKRIIGPQKDIIEVKNAIAVYDRIGELKAFELNSLCKAHEILMNGLIDHAGKLRSSSVGIVKGEQLAHLAPPGSMVRPLLKDLFSYLKKDDDLLLLKSCVFHYEFEFIHPFTDGNGRMGRLWQTLILTEYSPVFRYLPIETLIKERQQDYYNALNKSDSEGKSTVFIEFMLEIIKQALEDVLKNQNINLTNNDRISNFKDTYGGKEFTRQDYLRSFKYISSATASRDLKIAVDKNILEKKGDKRTTRYKFI
ncbi:MAG: Fic family protein [Cyclobacteriaceae bacterium]|jgi:Fic family protein